MFVSEIGFIGMGILLVLAIFYLTLPWLVSFALVPHHLLFRIATASVCCLMFAGYLVSQDPEMLVIAIVYTGLIVIILRIASYLAAKNIFFKSQENEDNMQSGCLPK